MPPKRAKGLKQSAAIPETENRAETDQNQPSSKRARVDSPKAANEDPVYIGDIEEENEVKETELLFHAAKQNLDQDQGLALLRACIHECSRILSASSLSDTELVTIYEIYAKSMFWLWTKAPQPGLVEHALELAKGDVLEYVQLGFQIVNTEDVPESIPSMHVDDRELLAWLAVRQFNNLDSRVQEWADVCVRLWDFDPDQAESKCRAMGSIYLNGGSASVAEQGDLVDQDEDLMDTDVVREAESTLLKALDWFTKAESETDHPSELIYQPLGEVHVQLAAVCEMLDKVSDAVGHYHQALKSFRKAVTYNADAVDPETFQHLDSCIESLVADLDESGST